MLSLVATPGVLLVTGPDPVFKERIASIVDGEHILLDGESVFITMSFSHEGGELGAGLPGSLPHM